MNDNLIFYINKLSYLIVAQELETYQNENQERKGGTFFNNCVRKVRQKGCDVLLNKCKGTNITDPCLTDYGGNWSPITLITDYGRDLEAEGYGKLNELLISWIKTLNDKEYDCVNDLLKFLLLLKKPLNGENSELLQSNVSLNNSDFFFNGINSSTFLCEEFSSESFFKNLSLRKTLTYEESWTRRFDSKFKVLGEFSKKSVSVPENASLKTIFSSKAVMGLSQSHSNSFDFTDFLNLRNSKTEKSLFNTNSSDYMNDNPLLDSFVDTPISHKLPSLKSNLKFSSKSGFLEKSNEEMENHLSSVIKNQNKNLFDQTVRKTSVIELKRNSNCSHSLSILFNKSGSSQVWDFRSNDSFSNSKVDLRDKFNSSNSKEIILGLWEQEQSIIKQFMPELASTFPPLRMLRLVDYIRDVKFLFTGIDSETFKYDPGKQGFNMIYGTCLDDVTPESLFHFSKEFMEIGDSYVNLMACVKEKDFNTCTSVSQIFWKSIFDYLELHYSLALEIPETTNLMALKSCTRDLHEIIRTVASMCKADTKGQLPDGGELLTYLLKIAERINKQCVLNIVLGILLNCCNVYFTCILQKWMFKGQLDCQNNEFFVDYRRQKVKLKSRMYYNSFFLVDEKIPNFLRGYEESFYNCGKSIHFLKLFNAEDAFCQLLEKGDYPSMKLCFSEDLLGKLEKEFKDYEERILKECGERLTIKMLKDEEQEKEKKLLEYVKASKQFEEKKIEELRVERLKKAKALKEEQNKKLNEQRAAIEAEKERKKEEEEKEKMRLEEKIKKAEEERENLLNEEKNKLIEVHEKMMENLNRRIAVAEERKENLQKILSNEQETDVINCNEIVIDNVATELDINSNTNSINTELRESVMSYDENLNPCLEAGNREHEMEIRRCVSYRTVAAEEAMKNKCRVLKSEFGLPTAEEQKPKKPKDTELERNRRKVMQSEYNILLKDSNISFGSVQSGSSSVFASESNLDDDKNPIFRSVDLKRKTEYVNINDPPKDTLEESCDSCGTLSRDSGENVSNEDQPPPHSDTALALPNEKYQDALNRDVEIFQKKSSHQNIFCCLKDEEDLDNLPCTDFLKLQRYLTKSALVPLKIQEKLANDALLKHLLKDENLLSHLNSLRGFFFLNDGEFGRSFTHNIFRSLAKCTEPSQFFERANLSNIVNEALNYTIHSWEPNAKNLSFQIVKMPPFLNHSSHDVLSPFELSYKVDWPLNFILTEKALSKYRTVFRFLIKLKRTNWTLNENYLYLNAHFKSSKPNGRNLVSSSHYHKIQIFRHAMTQVMITLDDFIFSNGVQTPWIFFLKDLDTTENIDHLYQKHVKYIKDVLTRCFLSKNSEDLLDCIHNLIELALKFHYTAKSSEMELVDGKYKHPKFSVLKGTFHEFCSVIKTFLKTLKGKLSSNEIHRSHYVLLEKFDLKLS